MCAPAPGRWLHRDHPPILGRMRMQLRLGRNRAVLKNAVRLLITTRDVEILAEAPRALGIYQLLVQFLVIDAADAAGCRVEFDTIERASGSIRSIYDKELNKELV